MPARPNQLLENTTFETRVVKNASALVAGVGVKLDADEVAVCVANDKVYGVATETITGDGVKTTVIAVSGGVVMVKASGTATQGEYAICGTDGFENQTIGGGSTVKYLAGQFAQTGVDGDFIGLKLGTFAAGAA